MEGISYLGTFFILEILLSSISPVSLSHLLLLCVGLRLLLLFHNNIEKRWEIQTGAAAAIYAINCHATLHDDTN